MPGEHHGLPEALLLLAPGCAHCPAVLAVLSNFVKDGRLGRLEVINIEARPEVAQAVGTRTVPWFRIGPYELSGAHSKSELLRWLDLATQGAGMAPYFSHLFETGQLNEVLRRVRGQPKMLHDLVTLLSTEETPMTARIGVGAALEELQTQDMLGPIIPELEELTRSRNAHIRADACHYLALAGDANAIPSVEALLDDEHAEVREIAQETLEELRRRRSDLNQPTL